MRARVQSAPIPTTYLSTICCLSAEEAVPDRAESSWERMRGRAEERTGARSLDLWPKKNRSKNEHGRSITCVSGVFKAFWLWAQFPTTVEPITTKNRQKRLKNRHFLPHSQLTSTCTAARTARMSPAAGSGIASGPGTPGWQGLSVVHEGRGMMGRGGHPRLRPWYFWTSQVLSGR